MKQETLEDRAQVVWENMRYACIRTHMALTKLPRYGEGYIIVSAVARFIRETGKQNDWKLDKTDIDLIRQFLKTTGNVVVLGESVGDYKYRIFVREEYNDTKARLTIPTNRGPDAIDQRAKKLRPEEVGEDREPAPVEVRKMTTREEYDYSDFSEAGADGPMTEPQVEILTFLLAHGEVTDEEGFTTPYIQKHIDTEVANPSSVLASLDDRGLIERDVQGKRTYHVALTNKGRELTSQGLLPFRMAHEALADWLVERGGSFECDKVSETTRRIGKDMRIPQTRVTAALRTLEKEGLIKVQRQGGYPRSVKWAGGHRETLRQKFGRWWSADAEVADVKKVAGITEEEKPEAPEPLETTSPVESAEDLVADELLPPEEFAAFLSTIAKHYKTAVEDIADVYQKEEDRYSEAKTTIDLVAEVLVEVNQGESSPLKALGDIEAIVSEWASG